MKTIKLSELEELITKYSKQESFNKPLMLWFASNNTLDNVLGELTLDMKRTIRIYGHPYAGHERVVIGDKVVKISNHPELLSIDELPIGYTENTQRVICHDYHQQLRKDKLDYYCHQLRKLQIPFICLVNDYSTKEEGSVDSEYIASHFEQYSILEESNE